MGSRDSDLIQHEPCLLSLWETSWQQLLAVQTRTLNCFYLARYLFKVFKALFSLLEGSSFPRLCQRAADHSGDPTRVHVPSRLEVGYFSSFAVKTEIEKSSQQIFPERPFLFLVCPFAVIARPVVVQSRPPGWSRFGCNPLGAKGQLCLRVTLR